jgi:hypothetical protein
MACFLAVAAFSGIFVVSNAAAQALLSQGSNDSNQGNEHPYLNEPLNQLVESFPELATVQPAASEAPLPRILEKTGKTVDSFFHNIMDLIADEQITEKKLNRWGIVRSKLRVRDSYLFLRRETETRSILDEYRMDAKGKPVSQLGLEKGYINTSNFALTHIYFSTALQSESRFRYLGKAKLGSCDTYVVAFAQKPEQASIVIATNQVGRGAGLFVQGIAWIDQQNFQIVRMRTDLLGSDARFAQLSTTMTFGEVQLPDLDAPYWLPSEVKLDVQTGGQSFENDYHYSNYRDYRVSVRMAPGAAAPPQ